MAKGALFLDRDGIINIDYNYVHKISDIVFVDGIFELVKKAHLLGLDIFVITNQSGIGRGIFSEDQFLELTSWIESEFSRADSPIKKTYFCPHHPDYALAPYRCECNCRKPKPGMILTAKAEFNVNLSKSIFIGDKQTDMDAAKAAGVASRVLISSESSENATEIYTSLLEFLGVSHALDSRE